MTSPDQTIAKPKSRKIIGHIIKVLLTVTILFFVARQVWKHWDQVQGFSWHLDWTYLVLSLLCAHLALLIFSDGWKTLVGGFGYHIPIWVSYKVFNIAGLGRYIPGKVWQVVGMLYYVKKEGVPAGHAAASFVLLQVFSTPASLLVYVLASLFSPDIMPAGLFPAGVGAVYIVGALTLGCCALLVLYPRPFLLLTNRILRLFGRSAVSEQFDKKVALRSFLSYVVGWIAYGLAYWLFLKSVIGDAALGPVAAVGLYNIAYQIGYLALFAPGGFGPRELVMGELLRPFVGPIGPAVAIIARLWSIVIELTAAGVALCLRKRSNTDPE
jgi:uncharacterized membrane protein YbhN (UPF0104 family)